MSDNGGADLLPGKAVIIAGLALGKPVGVFVFSWFAALMGLARRDPSLSWPFLVAGALLTGIGFTMSLFIAGLAYAPELLNAAKIGVLTGSSVSALAGRALLVWLTKQQRVT